MLKEPEDLGFVPALKLVKPEYTALLGNMKLYTRLFRLKYLEHVSDLAVLARLVGLRDACGVVRAERRLDAWLQVALGGSVDAAKLDMVCPSCLQFGGLTDYSRRGGEDIKRACCICGCEVDEAFGGFDEFDQSLDRDLTYAPTSKLSWSKGLGGTFNPDKDPKQYEYYRTKMLFNFDTPFEDFKKFFPELAAEFEKGEEFITHENGYVYRLMREGQESVRRVPVGVIYAALDTPFHALDLPLRKAKADRASRGQNDLKPVLGYAKQLCDSFDLKRENGVDQAFLNTFGGDVSVLFRQLRALRRHVSVKRLVDTVFVVDLLKFGKGVLAERAERELGVHFGLVNLIVDLEEFGRGHECWDESPVLFAALKQAAKRKVAP